MQIFWVKSGDFIDALEDLGRCAGLERRGQPRNHISTRKVERVR